MGTAEIYYIDMFPYTDYRGYVSDNLKRCFYMVVQDEQIRCQ